jgi:GNAT superfamily N-acetyltransferase
MFDLEVTASNCQLIAFSKLIANDHTHSDQFDRNGLAVSWSHSDVVFSNGLFLSERVNGVEDLAQRFCEAADYMRSKTQAGLFFACEQLVVDVASPQWETTVARSGLVPLIEVFGMAGDFLPFDRLGAPDGMHFQRASDEETIVQFADIHSAAYAMPPEGMQGELRNSTLWQRHALSYVGYHEGKPVSAASVLEINGQVYTAYVATRPEVQRRGFGDATLRHALTVAHEATGWRRASLHSSLAAVAMHEKMGYRRTARFIGYGLPPV